jgi:hypothetical protein
MDHGMEELGVLGPHLVRDLDHARDLQVIPRGDHEGKAEVGEIAYCRVIAVWQDRSVIIYLEIAFCSLPRVDLRVRLRGSGVE